MATKTASAETEITNMNPPSALFGAMNKDRKPFTYTPGGIDLSEIKSERMAQRLMRNAMSEGVPETQVQSIQSPPAHFNSTIPNFNCLPVQVFPTFPLPANPKSLLKSRSNPDPLKEPPTNTNPASSLFISDDKPSADTWQDVNKPSLFTINNNNGSSSTKDTKSAPNNSSLFQQTNYGSDGHTEMILPEKCFDDEYFVLKPQGNMKLMKNQPNKLENNTTICQHNNKLPILDIIVDTASGIEKNPEVLASSSSQDRTTNDFEQKKVKTIKKQSKTSENDADQNGDTEATVIVKLPTKKSSAKTETKVEVLKKTLPDGTIEEVKKTITKTTIDGKTEIKTETETRILPKEEDDSVEIEQEVETEQEVESEDVVVEENESDQNEENVVEDSTTVTTKVSSENKPTESEEESKDTEIKENGHFISGKEKTEISTKKKVVVIQSTDEEHEEEQDEEEEEEIEDGDVEVEEVIVLKKVEDKETEKPNDMESEEKLETAADVGEEEVTEEVEEVEEEEEEVVDEENVEDEQENIQVDDKKDTEQPEEDEDIEAEQVEAEEEQNENEDEIEEQDQDQKQSQENEITTISSEEKEKPEDDAEEEYEEAEDVQLKTDSTEKLATDNDDKITEQLIKEKANESSEKAATFQEPSTKSSALKEDITKEKTDEQERVVKITIESEPKVTFPQFVEPSIPLEKVEDVEIKPIGPAQEIIKKCHTEIITTTKDEPTGALSTQTNYNIIENIVTVNRTTKILDHAYEQAESSIPSVKPYYVPTNVCPPDRILSTPQPVSRSYQPVYTPEPQTERRHSLLLDRLSMERQIPVQQSDIYHNNYQYNNQNYEQNQWSQEPQSEVLTVSNVKPSTITKNQQWYQQSKRDESSTSNIVTPTPIMPSQLSQPQAQPKPQPQQQPQPQVQPQTQYQNYVQPQYTTKSEFQPAYTDNRKQNSFKSGTTNFQRNTFPRYTPKPSWVSSTFDSKPAPATQYNQYSTLKKESSESYQKTTQPFSSSYVPPPWEQDSSYVVENQNFYQPPPTTAYTPSINQSWKPKQPASKYSKPPPTAYIPPAPNQSFVKPVSSSDANAMPGRKTYYSEYERRYISVPESTYIPSETKYQAQPDPSPQYYFDNNEPSETIEPQWRKELREFTEKTTTTQTEKTSVKPPWEEDPKYATGYNTYTTSTVTPSWNQTLRPRSWRETSYEPEYSGSKEWPKTNTFGRGRPQSSYVRNNVDTIRERTRGVSVDRYNPNSYQSPPSSEHPPVQSHTLNTNIHPKTYHNPNVPAYHARTSAESREQTAPYIQRTWGESKAPPVQSRSFKYLQWITGTED